MRMSAATNKDYSEGEINSIMFGDTNEIWACVWRIPDFIEDPLVLVSALYFTFAYMGWYAFIILGMVFLQIGMGYLREKAGNKIDKEQKEKNKDRMRYINESFHNIKGIKLYGWENKLLGRIEDVYQQEVALEDQTLVRNKVYDFFTGTLTVSLPVILYGLYVKNGNVLNLSSIAVVNMMIGKIQYRVSEIKRLFKDVFRVLESMQRLNDFFVAPEIQKGLIDKKTVGGDDDDGIALSIKGNFSWGVTPALESSEKDKQQDEAKKQREAELDKTQNAC